MLNLLVIHGPNLNLLGRREPDIYGNHTLNQINNSLKDRCKDENLICFQSNCEGELINFIQENMCSAKEAADFIIINPAAFTHTSIALCDALLSTSKPFIEVHISNIYSRESFRHQSFFSPFAKAVISGLGVHGYQYALDYALNYLHQKY